VAGEAGDGLTAIAEFNRINPDIVLMDITMPQMEGIEAVERIVATAPECAHRHGLVRRIPGEHPGGAAERRQALRAEAGEAGSAVRNSSVRAQRRSQRRRRTGGVRRRTPLMRMELIQPFINAADAVFAESLQAPTKIVGPGNGPGRVSPQGRRCADRHQGDIEGRVILDLSPEVAMKVATFWRGRKWKRATRWVRETVCEMANMVIGNSVRC